MKEFDIFRNTDDLTVERIANIHPILTDEEKERMFAMSERKFNITEKKFPQGNMNSAALAMEDGVEGVEEYDRPAWLRYLSTAAALILLGGGIALCKNLIMRRPSPEINNNNTPPPVIATEIETGTTVTSGADNSKYTTVSFDVDAILTGTGTAAAPAAETTAAPAATEAPTAAPTQAPTEPPTTAAPTYDIESYKTIAKDLEEKWFKIERLNSNYYGNAAIDQSFKVYKIYDDGSAAEYPVYYVRSYDQDISSIEDYLNLHASVFTDSPYFHDIYGADPEGSYYTIHPIISDASGLLYKSYYPKNAAGIDLTSGLYTSPNDTNYISWNIDPDYDYNMLGDTDVIIENPTDTSFDAIIPVCFYSPNGGLQIKTDYDDSSHNYYTDKWHIVNVNGQWRIQLGAQDSREWVSYSEYMAKLNAQ